jgi:hypothetical protein
MRAVPGIRHALDIEHIAEFAVLFENCVNSLDSLLQCSANAEEGHLSFREITDYLILKPLPLLISTAVPRVSVCDVRVAEEKQIVPLFGFHSQSGQN